MSNDKEKTVLSCKADGCGSTVVEGSHEWRSRWCRVWVEDMGALLDACSSECAEKIKTKEGTG